MEKLLIISLLCISFFSCKNQVERKVVNKRQEKEIKFDNFFQKRSKTFYYASYENKIYRVDTLRTITLSDSIIIDKIDMDWYVINVKNLKKTDVEISFISDKECFYPNFEEKNIKWVDLTLPWYKKTKIKKSNKSFLWELSNNDEQRCFLIDSLNLKDVDFIKYSVYENEDS